MTFMSLLVIQIYIKKTIYKLYAYLIYIKQPIYRKQIIKQLIPQWLRSPHM